MMKKLTILLGFGALWFAGAASAGDITLDASNQCSVPAATYGMDETDVDGDDDGIAGSIDCWGTFDGNDPGDQGSIWIDGVEYDFISRFNVGGAISGYDIGLDTSGGSSGTWSYDSSLFSADYILVVLKAASSPGFAIYLLSGVNDSGTFQIVWSATGNDDAGLYGDALESCVTDPGNVIGPCAGLSHLSIYAANYRVPEPGTAALLGLSLIGLGMARRRRQS